MGTARWPWRSWGSGAMHECAKRKGASIAFLRLSRRRGPSVGFRTPRRLWTARKAGYDRAFAGLGADRLNHTEINNLQRVAEAMVATSAKSLPSCLVFDNTIRAKAAPRMQETAAYGAGGVAAMVEAELR